MSAGAEVGGRLGAALRWWTGELAGLLPQRLRGLASADRPTLLATPRDGRVALSRLDRRGETQLGSLDGLAGWRRRRLAAQARSGALEVYLAADPSQTARRRVTLPLAAEKDVAAALALDLDRLTPFDRGDLLWRWRRLGGDGRSGGVDVELIFAPKATWAAESRALEAAGLPVTGVAVRDGGDGPISPPLRADPTQPPGRWSLSGRLALVGLGALAAALVATVMVDMMNYRRDAVLLRARVEAARADLRATAARDAGLERRIGAMRAERPFAVATLDALSETLPDDAWLQRLTLSDGRVTMEGSAADATRLLTLLEDAETFEAPRFTAPLRRVDDGRERFFLSVRTVLREERAAR